MSDEGDAGRLYVRFDADITRVVEQMKTLQKTMWATSSEVKKAWKDSDLQRLETTNKLAIAQASGNKVEIAQLTEQLALQNQILNFRKLGLTVTEATAAAERQVAALRAAEAIAAKAESNGNLGLAITRVFDRSRLGLVEEAGVKVGVFGSALEALGPAGIVAAVGVVAAGIAIEGAVKGAEHAEELEKTAKAIGVTVTQLQEYHHAALEVGIDNKTMDVSLQGLNGTLGKLQSGVGDARQRKVLDMLGLSRADLADYHTAAEFIPALADKIKALDSEAKKVQVVQAFKIPELLPLLEEGSAGINRLRQDAHDLGVVLDEDLIRHSAEMNAQLKEAKEVIGTQLTAAFLTLLPVISMVASAIEKAASKLTDFLGISKQARIAALKDNIAQNRQDIEDIKDGGLARFNILGPMAFVPGHPHKSILQRQGEIDAETAQLADITAPPPPVPAAKDVHIGEDDADRAGRKKAEEEARKALERSKKSLDAIAQAEEDELAARLGLTVGAHEQLALQLEQIDRATAKKVADLDAQAKLNQISRAAADEAISATRTAAGEKKALAVREAKWKAEDQVFALIEKQVALLKAQADGSHRPEDALAADLAAIEVARQKANAEAARKGLDGLADITANNAQAVQTSKNAVGADAERVAKDQASLAESSLQTQITTLQDQEALARSSAERRAIALHLLDLEKQLEAAKLQEIIASQTASDAQKAIAREQLNALGTQYDAKRQATLDSTAGPLETWRKTSLQSTAEVRDAFEEIVTKGIDSFNSGLADAIVNAKSWGDVMRSVIQQIEKDLITLALKQAEASAFGGGGLGGIFGALGKAVGIGGSAAAGVGETASSFGGSWAGTVGTFAGGTDSAPGGPAIVGERGPELVNLPRGAQVIPNDSLVRSLRSPVASAQTHLTTINQTFVLDARYGITTPELLQHVNTVSEQKAAAYSGQAYARSLKDMPAALAQNRRMRPSP